MQCTTCTMNSDGIFQEHIGNICPESLIFNKGNVIDTSAHVLDLSIDIIGGRFIVEVYDKREYLPSYIVQFSPKCSNVLINTLVVLRF